MADFHRFYNTLQRCPTEIAICVRHLKLSAVIVGIKPDTENFAPFAEMVGSFTLLQSVEIYFLDVQVRWSDIQPEMLDVISRLIQTPTLASLTLRSITGIPLSCFIGLGNKLHHLSLYNVEISNIDQRPAGSPAKPIRFERYSINQSNLLATNTLLDVMSPTKTPIFNFGSLKHLNISAKFTNQSYTDVLYKLLGMASRLSTLELQGECPAAPVVYAMFN